MQKVRISISAMVGSRISIKCNRIEHWVHLRCADIRLARPHDNKQAHIPSSKSERNLIILQVNIKLIKNKLEELKLLIHNRLERSTGKLCSVHSMQK